MGVYFFLFIKNKIHIFFYYTKLTPSPHPAISSRLFHRKNKHVIYFVTLPLKKRMATSNTARKFVSLKLAIEWVCREAVRQGVIPIGRADVRVSCTFKCLCTVHYRYTPTSVRITETSQGLVANPRRLDPRRSYDR